MSDVDAPVSVRVPADVDQPDQVVAGLSMRQLIGLAVIAAALFSVWSVLDRLLPEPVPLIVIIPIAVVGFVAVVGSRDGVSFDRLALAAITHAWSAKRLVPAEDGVEPLPRGWIPDAGRESLPGPLRFPASTIDAGGVLDLPGRGVAVLVAVSSVNVGLMSARAQEALVAGLARWWNWLPCPAQIVVYRHPVDMTPPIQNLERATADLESAQVHSAADDYVDFLADLGAGGYTARSFLVVLRNPDLRGKAADRRARTLQWATDGAALLSQTGLSARVLDQSEACTAIASVTAPLPAPWTEQP